MIKRRAFNCYICGQEKTIRHKDLVVGTGKLMQYICKKCTKDNYAITNT